MAPHLGIAIYAALPYNIAMHSVIETSIFTRRADALLSAEDKARLIDKLAIEPLAGDLVPGLAGVRKLRFASTGRGQRGGFRVIYYVLTDDMPILALLIYGKNEQADMTPDQRRALLTVVEATKTAHRTGRT